jgi:hypothetical protein
VDAVAKNTSTSLYGSVVTFAESPLKEGVLFAGTDDGLVQISENGGQSWRKIDHFAGVPDTTFVVAPNAVAARREHRVRVVRQSQERRLPRRTC